MGNTEIVKKIIHCLYQKRLVGMTTGYGLDGPGIKFRSGRNFPYPSRSVLGPTQPPLKWLPCHALV